MKTKIVIVSVLCLSLVACSFNQVLADIDVLIQIAANLAGAIGALSPADATEVTKFTTIATNGVAAIQAAYATYQASGAMTDLAKVQAAINSLQSNLNQELAAAKISDPHTVQVVTNWVNLLNAGIDAIVAALPQLSPDAAHVATVKVTAKSLQQRWKKDVCGGDKACGKRVVVHSGFWASLGNGWGEAKFGH